MATVLSFGRGVYRLASPQEEPKMTIQICNFLTAHKHLSHRAWSYWYLLASCQQRHFFKTIITL